MDRGRQISQPDPSGQAQALRMILRDIVLFCEHASGLRLREYQKEVARAVIDSVKHQRGLSLVVIFPRQSGKNELQAQIETYLLTVLSTNDCEIVKASPTWKPQTVNAMRRLERVLQRNLFTRNRWQKESGYIYRLGRARITFLSGSETANVVGATANLLLECDEAQDISLAKWDKDFAPMAASTNATRIFWGTSWTSQTLLARELRAAQEAEKTDGLKRVFRLDAEQVAAEVPAYGKFVAEQVARLGRNHPLIRTQFFSEEIGAQSGMFPPERLAQICCDLPLLSTPEPLGVYALCLDVAGQATNPEANLQGVAEAASTSGTVPSTQDSSVATILEVDLSHLPPHSVGPIYRVVRRLVWQGVPHTQLYAQVKALAEEWLVRYLVVDATGLGEGVAAFLEKALPGRVIPFRFTQKSKSDLGWKFLALIETGRFKENPHESLFFYQARYCQSQVGEGPQKTLTWGVPAGTRHELSGELVHDDAVLSCALAAVLDEQDWWTRVTLQEHFESLNQVTGTLVGTVGTLPAVAEGAEYSELKVGDSPETASFTKYGGYLPLTLELIDRDDTRKLRQYPRELAKAGMRRISALVSAVFTDNSGIGPTLADGGALFNPTAVTTAGGHANLRTTALSSSEWENVCNAVYSQPLLVANESGYYGSGAAMAVDPRYLLVPRELKLTAMKILYPEWENASNIHSENLQRGAWGDVVVVPEWTDASDWAAMSDPRLVPGIVICERFGLMPEVFIAGDELSPAVFMNDEHRIKVRHFIAVLVQDFRAMHKSNVA